MDKTTRENKEVPREQSGIEKLATSVNQTDLDLTSNDIDDLRGTRVHMGWVEPIGLEVDAGDGEALGVEAREPLDIQEVHGHAEARD